MHSLKSGVVNRWGQYVVCGQAKRKSIRHESLCKKLAGLNGQEKLSADLYVASETKGNCDHAMGIVSEGEGGECRLFDNTWTGNGNSKLYTMNSFASSLSNANKLSCLMLFRFACPQTAYCPLLLTIPDLKLCMFHDFFVACNPFNFFHSNLYLNELWSLANIANTNTHHQFIILVEQLLELWLIQT